jgi:ubiquinone/menaquinone biosynthesis C-methylase UbiE
VDWKGLGGLTGKGFGQPLSSIVRHKGKMKTVYDNIGIGYTKHRCADSRIVEALVDILALSPPALLADIGAGTGNYCCAIADLGFHVCAVDPSATMRGQAPPHDSVHWYCGTAQHIPLGDRSVDGVFCILASHHFSSLEAGAIEMARICSTGPIVWFTFDPRQAESPWLRDYFSVIWESAFEVFPPLEDVCRLFEIHTHRHVTVTPWSIPYDLQDCFMAAGWRTPEMYLDPEVRACNSAFALADPGALEDGLTRLRHDITTGAWRTKYGDLLERETLDWGYRFIGAVRETGEQGVSPDRLRSR